MMRDERKENMIGLACLAGLIALLTLGCIAAMHI